MKKVWVNGTFDVLHAGHLKMLEYAKSLGVLVVGIDSDKRVKELKGESRPFNNVEDRKYFLQSLKFVDEVVVFDSREELINCVKEYQPDYMVVGDDYRNEIVYGSEHAKELVFYKKLLDYSTTKILKYENNSTRGVVFR
jgi:D-beta-D-heptose 7-phosphate kinase/D-beta-D-heptose 1-phosphate adenosyltransferase